jgi:hypothetical protein
LLVLIDEDRLGGGGTAIDAHEAFDHLAGMELGGHEFLGLVALLEFGELLLGLAEAAAALFLFFLEAADVEIPLQVVGAAIDAHGIVFVLAKLDRAQGGVVLGVFGNQDQRLRGPHPRAAEVLRSSQTLGDVRFPAVAHAADVGVGAAEEQNLGTQGIAAGQHGEVLLHDGFKEGSHQFVAGHAALLQAVDVGFGEDAALAGHRVQLDAECSPSRKAARRECAAWR